jgi:hypothetical protein
VLFAEVVCVVTELDTGVDTGLDVEVGSGGGRAAAGVPGRAEFPWFLGPADATVVDGAVTDADRARPAPVIEAVPEPARPPGSGAITRR